MQKMILRRIHLATATALCCWLDNAMMMLRIRRASDARQQRSLEKAFTCWIDASTFSKHANQRWKGLAIRAATSLHISRWVQYVGDVKHHARQNMAAVSRGSDRYRTRMALLPAFVYWHYTIRCAAVLQAQQTRAVAFRLARTCRTRAACVLAAWMEHACVRRWRRRALDRFVDRQRLLAVEAWFSSWVAETEPSGYHTPLEGEQDGLVCLARESSSSNANQSTELTASTIKAASSPAPMLLSSRRSGALVRRLAVC